MVRWAFSIGLICLATLASLVVSTPSPPPPPQLQFSHKSHLDYFRDRHAREMVSMHAEIFEDFKDGSHGRSMVAHHKQILMKELQDETLVDGMLGDVGKGSCTMCHRDYDSNARNLALLLECAQCHRRKKPENTAFAAEMIADVERGHCTLCHGDFDKNGGETPARVGHCAECHRTFLERDWEDWEEQKEVRPCMGCHNSVTHSPRASIPSTNTCAACHQPPLLPGDSEETKLVKFIERGSAIPWERGYDYLPSEIVFSHERHVELGRVACQECHGPVELAEHPLSLRVKLSMEACMACHEAAKADNDCLACHR